MEVRHGDEKGVTVRVEGRGGHQPSEPIYARHARLKSILAPRRPRRGRICQDDNLSGLEDFAGEVLLDSFLALYDSWDRGNSKGSYEQYFVSKYAQNVDAIKKNSVGIQDFELGSVVGRGRFAEVVVAKEKGSGRVYALKTMRKSEALVQSNIPGIDAELEILSSPKNPFLVSLKYSFHDAENLYFAMDYMPGGDLSALLKRSGEKLPEVQTRFYMAELLLAVNAVHCLGFVHRDIKPENILFDRHGHLKLADFGSSARLDSAGTVVTKVHVDTDPEYVAPEVLESLEDDEENLPEAPYGTASDYWSFGVIAYACSFGMNPFKGESGLETFRNVISYKTCFTIPSGSYVCAELCEMIRELVIDQTSRLGYEQLLRHPFFNSIIWDGLQNVIYLYEFPEVPPFIPVVASDDDVSNFSPSNKSSFVGATKDSENPFSFVGFTRTLQEATSNFNVSFNSTANSSFMSTDGSFGQDDRSTIVQLRAEIAARDEALAHKNAEVLNYENQVEMLEAQVSEKDMKIAKVSAEAKRLAVEKGKLVKELEDERDYRQELEEKSHGLVADIRASQQNKLVELEAEIATLKQKIFNRDEQVQEMQDAVKKLRCENFRLANHLEKEQSNSRLRESNARASRSYRGSINMLESRLETSTMELETRIQQINRKHEQDLEDLLAKHAETEQNYEAAIERYKAEINDLIGRLEESRRSREATLEERNQVYRDHMHTKQMKQRLESYVHELEEKIKKLDDEKLLLAKEVENELERTRCDRDRLSLRIESLQTETHEKESKIRDLSKLVDRLEELIEQQRVRGEEFYAKNQDYGRQEGAVAVLQEQLLKFQQAAESTRESLFEEKQTSKSLSKTCADLEQELTVTKLDLKFALKDKKEVEALLDRVKAEQVEQENALKAAQAEIGRLETEWRNAEQNLDVLKLSLESTEHNLAEKSKLFEDIKKEHEIQCVKIDELTRDLDQCNLKLKEFELLRISVSEREMEMRKKNELLDEKDRSISYLESRIDGLKNLITMLEDQLKEFEKVVASNNEEKQGLSDAKAKSESEKASLMDELRAARTTINELRSLKAFDDQQLKHTTAALKAEESRRQEEVAALNEKLQDLKDNNEEMAFRLAELEENLEELSVLKSSQTSALEGLKRENYFLREEGSRNVTQFVRLKERNIELQNALEETLSKAEAFKSRWEAVTEEKMMLEGEKMEVEAQLQATFSHQLKLVEYLQDKCSAAANKKKKTFPSKIFFKEKGDPVEKDLLNLLLSTPPSVPAPCQVTPLSYRNAATSTPVSRMSGVTSPNMESHSTPRTEDSRTKLHPILEEELSEEQQLIQERNTKERQLNNLIHLHEQVQQEEDDKENVGAALPHKSPEPTFKVQTIFQDGGKPEERSLGQVNCVRELGKDLYVMGSENGLFSRKLTERGDKCVKIEGVGKVEQIEFLFQENLAVLIEGDNRKLISIPYGMLEACAKAAACSKPEVGFGQEELASLEGVETFRVQGKKNNDGHLIVAILKDLVAVLDWHKDGFVLKHKLETPEKATGLLTEMYSAFFACCGKVYQLVFEDFSLHEFMDDSDEALGYAVDESSSGPLAILNVGRSNLARGATVYKQEYLICLPDFAIFVDAHGKRSRSECILWNKVPLGVEYHHPNLYVAHYNSVEVLQLDPQSFTKSRVALSRDSIGKEVASLPQTYEFSPLINPRIVGLGTRTSSILIFTDDKLKSTILDLNLLVAEFMDTSSEFSCHQSYSSLSSQTTSRASLVSGESEGKASKSSVTSLSSAGTGRVANVWKSQRSSVLLPTHQKFSKAAHIEDVKVPDRKVRFSPQN